MVDHAESFDGWGRFFQYLKSRGIQSPKWLFQTHMGLKIAIEREFIGTSWQRCNVHFKRNIFNTIPKKDTAEIRTMIKRIFEAVTIDDMRAFKSELIHRYGEDQRFKKALEILEDGFEDSIQQMIHPEPIRKHIRSTNSLERLNQEVRRRENVIRIFPNTQSAFCLIGAVLMEYEKTFSKRKLG